MGEGEVASGDVHEEIKSTEHVPEQIPTPIRIPTEAELDESVKSGRITAKQREELREYLKLQQAQIERENKPKEEPKEKPARVSVRDISHEEATPRQRFEKAILSLAPWPVLKNTFINLGKAGSNIFHGRFRQIMKDIFVKPVQFIIRSFTPPKKA